MKKKTVRIIIIVAAVVVALAAALFLVRYLNKNKKVSVFPVSMVCDSWWNDGSQYSGTVTTGRVQNVRLRNALVENIPVEEGQHVNAGDVLLVYDAAEYQLTLLSDEANIAVLEARIERSRRMAAHYASLRPSEDAPQPYEETIDHGELPIKKKLTADDLKVEKESSSGGASGATGAGSGESGAGASGEGAETKVREFEFLITPDTVIEQGFLKKLREEGWICRLILYQDDANFGTVTIDGRKIPAFIYTYDSVIALGCFESAEIHSISENSAERFYLPSTIKQNNHFLE